MILAKQIAQIMSDNGLAVSSPDDGTLDDVERERWNVCVKIAEVAVHECIGIVTAIWGADLVTTQAALEELISEPSGQPVPKPWPGPIGFGLDN